MRNDVQGHLKHNVNARYSQYGMFIGNTNVNAPSKLELCRAHSTEHSVV